MGVALGSAVPGLHRQRAAPARRRRAAPPAQALRGARPTDRTTLALRRPPPVPPGERLPRRAVRALRGDDARRPRRARDHHLRPLSDGDRYESLGQVEMPHSLGLLYERITRTWASCTRRDEYKVMALAALRHAAFLPQLREHRASRRRRAVPIAPTRPRRACSARRASAARRSSSTTSTSPHSLQDVLEETVLRARRAGCTGAAASDNLCMAGGVALNCVMNARLRDAGLFERVWVQPAAGDAGTALGAALWIDCAGARRRDRRAGAMDHAFLGPELQPTSEIEQLPALGQAALPAADDIADDVARAAGRRQDHRLVPGPHGIRSARARRAFDPGLADRRRRCRRGSTS